MGLFLNLYKLKIRTFLGAIRASKLSVLLVALYFLGVLPGSIGMSIAIVNVVREGIDLTVHIDSLSTVISGVIAMILISSLRGYTVFEYEQSLIFTSYIMPRTFLVASLLADLTALSFFFFPLYLFLAIIIISLALPTVSASVIAIGLLLLIFFLFFVKTSFSILVSVRTDSLMRIITAVFVFFLLLPAASLGIPSFPLEYRILPYPSTFFAEALIDALRGNLPVQPILGILSFFLTSSVLFVFCSKKNLFHVAKAVPLVSPFDTSMRMQTVKMGQNIRLFSRIGLRFSLGLGSESLLRFLMKKELIRMIRDGSLFVVLVFYLVASIIGLATRQASFPVWFFILAIYSFIAPAMLIGNWRVSELDNLWIPLTSGVDPGYIAKSLLYDFILIASIVPTVVLAILAFLGVDPFVPLVLVISVSLIGCSANLFTMMYFLGKKLRATPSFMIGWVSMLLTSLLSSPTYIYTALSLGLSREVSLPLGAAILVYSTSVLWFFSRRIERKAGAIEI